MKNSIFARFARAFFIYWHFEDLLVLSTTWYDLFCSCVDDESIWWLMFNFVLLCPKRWFQFNCRIVRTHFPSIMTLNNWKIIAETPSYISRWRPRFRRLRLCLYSLFSLEIHEKQAGNVFLTCKSDFVQCRTTERLATYSRLCPEKFASKTNPSALKSLNVNRNPWKPVLTCLLCSLPVF